MDTPNYYTDIEMMQKMQQLLDAGKPVTDICNDPRCLPDIKAKLLELQKSFGKAAIQSVLQSFNPSIN